jgi:hypothetical protein
MRRSAAKWAKWLADNRWPATTKIPSIAAQAAGERGSACQVDAIEGYPLPILLVRGWINSREEPEVVLEMADGRRREPDFLFRVAKPDVAKRLRSDDIFLGFVAEFSLCSMKTPRRVIAGGRSFKIPHLEQYGVVASHYSDLLAATRIWRREDIYGFGPPVDANPHVTAIARGLPGPNSRTAIASLRPRSLLRLLNILTAWSKSPLSWRGSVASIGKHSYKFLYGAKHNQTIFDLVPPGEVLQIKQCYCE